MALNLWRTHTHTHANHHTYHSLTSFFLPTLLAFPLLCTTAPFVWCFFASKYAKFWLSSTRYEPSFWPQNLYNAIAKMIKATKTAAAIPTIKNIFIGAVSLFFSLVSSADSVVWVLPLGYSVYCSLNECVCEGTDGPTSSVPCGWQSSPAHIFLFLSLK